MHFIKSNIEDYNLGFSAFYWQYVTSSTFKGEVWNLSAFREMAQEGIIIDITQAVILAYKAIDLLLFLFYF